MSDSLKANLDNNNLNTLSDATRAARLGSTLSQVSKFADEVVASDVLVLPAGAKATQVISAFASASGNSAEGPKLPVLQGTTPAAGAVAVTVLGDIEFNGTDDITQAEVYYLTTEGPVVSELVTVAASAGLFAARKGLEVLSAVVQTGVTPGLNLTLEGRGATPGVGEVVLNNAGTGLVFNAANVVAGSVLVSYKATPGSTGVLPSLGASLDGTASNLIP